jgi:hypothetical protein
MQRIRLTATEQAQLEQIFKMTDDRRLRDRCQAVLMAHRGRKLLIVRINVVSPTELLSPKCRNVFDSKEKAEKRSAA